MALHSLQRGLKQLGRLATRALGAAEVCVLATDVFWLFRSSYVVVQTRLFLPRSTLTYDGSAVRSRPEHALVLRRQADAALPHYHLRRCFLKVRKAAAGAGEGCY